jgi:hypothetical protein
MADTTFQGITAIEVDSDAAGITVTSSGAGATTVALVDRSGEPRPELLEVTQEGETLRLRVNAMREGRWRRARNLDVRLLVEAPAAASLQVRSDAGATKVVDRDGAVRVSTRAGAIKLEDLRGGVEARTDAGSIKVEETRGRVVLASQAGAIRIERHLGESLELSASVGAIKGSGLEVGTLRASTEVGAIKLAFATPPVEVEARSSVGAISVEVPNDAYEIDQQVGSLGRAKLEGISSTPGAARRIRVATTGAGASKIVGAGVAAHACRGPRPRA